MERNRIEYIKEELKRHREDIPCSPSCPCHQIADLLTALAERDREIEQRKEAEDSLQTELKRQDKRAEVAEENFEQARKLYLETLNRAVAAEREVAELKNPKEFIMCPCCLMREIRIKELEAQLAAAKEGNS